MISQLEKSILYNKIARPSGGFAMVAIDQRESLRSMFTQDDYRTVKDDILVKFKICVAEVLSRNASAMLFDRSYGLKALKTTQLVAPDCGIIVSADCLVQNPGESISDTYLDEHINPQKLYHQGIAALKLLLIWRGKQNAEKCYQLAKKFMEWCNSANLLGILEPVVRMPFGQDNKYWDRENALLEPVKELKSIKPDLFKIEVPYWGNASAMEITKRSELITKEVSCPWVVLSSGVKTERFKDAVEAACKGGASGFLAGRAIWHDVIHKDEMEVRKRLISISLPKLTELSKVVDNNARPWNHALLT
jgi:sulfofructosephosphate aldolase